MEQAMTLRYLPTMDMIADALIEMAIPCMRAVRKPARTYSGIRTYWGQKELQENILYLLTEQEANFPTNTYAYISTDERSGEADHLICAGSAKETLLNRLLSYFDSCKDIQFQIDQMIFRGAGLQELCCLGEKLLGNPVCIHDDWFIMTAMSPGVQAIISPEYVSTSVKGFIPRAILEDFKHDSDYLETYAHRRARLWVGTDGARNSLYVNLWDGAIYRGRLLVFQQQHAFRREDYLMAELLAQRAMSMLERQNLEYYQGMDGVVYQLLSGELPEPAELDRLLHTLRWSGTDRLACVIIKPQETSETSFLEHALHSELFQIFPDGYILLSGGAQCLILNISRNPISRAQLHHQLAPVCRDYCLYAGISSPAAGLRDLHLAYCEAEAAIKRTFQLRNEQWILFFSDCALDYLLNCVAPPLMPQNLIAPGLIALKDHDLEKGTQYFETLRAYLLQERDIPKTAQSLIIHRTTLLYRLKKLQPLLGIDLDDPWKRLYLMISLFIMERQEGIPKQNSSDTPS